jgi:cytoskeletal protein RodZ
MKKIFYFMVTVLLLAAVFLGVTGCMKEEMGIKSSSQQQNETKQRPDSPEPQKNVGIEPFDHLGGDSAK